MEYPIPMLRQETDRVITHTCFYVAGIGLIPIPLLDASLILGAQMIMIRSISKIYGIPFKKQVVKTLIGSLTGSLGTIGAVKFIPGLGSALGGAAVSTVGVGTTYALGQVFSNHFSKGGNFTDFKAEDWQIAFQNYYKKKEIESYKNATAAQLIEKRVALSQELKVLQDSLDKLQKQQKNITKAKRNKRRRKWMISILAIGVVLFGGWFFRESLFPAKVNKAMEEVVSESGEVLYSAEQALGIDSLIQDVSAGIDSLSHNLGVDSLLQNISTEVDSTLLEKKEE